MDESTVGALKRCGKCGETKPTTAFEKKLKRDGTHAGRAGTCLVCQAAHYDAQARKDALLASGFSACCTCRRVKPLTDFYPSRNTRRGVCARCKACAAARPRKRDTEEARHRSALAALAGQGLRRCAACAETLRVEQFYAHKRGRSSYCKQCHGERQRQRMQDPAFAAQRRVHSQLPHVKAKRQARNDAYWRNPANREKLAARKAVYKALKSGRLKRGPCGECGKPDADAHHHNGYAREHRLDVEWLCRSCHLRHHRSPAPEPRNPTTTTGQASPNPSMQSPGHPTSSPMS